MKYFSGFCLKNDKSLFKNYLEENEFTVAGFSYGAQKALEYVLSTKQRIDKLQLLSPAFFNTNPKFIDINIKAFRKDKFVYIKNFLEKAGINQWEMGNGKWKINLKGIEIDYSCSEEDLIKLFTFNWERIENLKNIKIEVFLGEYDRILALKKAEEFFKKYGSVYLIKKANHFLRS